MATRKHKLGALVGVAAAAAFSVGIIGAHAAPLVTETDDNYIPASTQVTGTSHQTVFSVGPITVTCTNSVAGGKTPALGIKPFAIKPLPVFNDGSSSAPCTDTVGATDTTTTSGAWKIQLKDAPNDETQTEPNSGDKLIVTVPIGGAVVNNSFGCVITVAPTAAFKVIGTYDDHNTFTVNISNLPIKVTGPAGVCPLSSTTSTFSGTYVFTPGVSDGS